MNHREFGVTERKEGPHTLAIAPSSGYQPVVRYQSAVSGSPWRDFGEKSFFLRTNDLSSDIRTRRESG